MAASSSSLSLSLQLLRHGALCRPSSSPSVVHLQPTRGLKKSVAAASYHDDDASSAGRGDHGSIATSVLLRQEVDDDAAVAGELRAPRATKGRAPPLPKGRPGKSKEGGGGKIHAAPASVAKGGQRSPAPPGGLPQEGSGGQGGSIH